MREYGQVHSTFWSSQTTHDLPDDSKLLALYLLTGPHSTALGCYRCPDGYVMEDLRWEIGRVAKAFAQLSAKGWANRCETTKWVLISNYLKWNPPDNPNQRKNLHRLAAQVPENFSYHNELKHMIIQQVGPSDQLDLPLAGSNGSQTLPQTVKQPFRNQEQEQEQEQGSQNHHAYGAAMTRWATVKLELQKQLPTQQYNHWVRPAYLLKLMSGGALIALPPNGRVIETATENKAMLAKVAAKHGFAGISFTRYPDEHELQRLKKESPEFFAQFSPALQRKVK